MTLSEQLNASRHANAELRKTIAENARTIAALNATIEKLTKLIETLNHANEQQAHQIEELQALIKSLQDEVARLRESINKNSRNSSKPPSTDGLKKPSPVSLRDKSGKKKGGQEGHNGAHLATIVEPDHIEPHMPSGCESCPHYADCKSKACIAEKRSVIDAVINVDITEHQALKVECPLGNGTLRGTFPDNVRGPIQYGEELQALVVSLNTVGAVSVNRIHEILGNVFNIPLSTGVIYNIIHRCAENVTETVSHIADHVKDSSLAHFDETGTRVDGKLWWVHNASNACYTHLEISPKRGSKGMDEIGILPEFHGIAVHDCWAPYWNYPDLIHAICNAHITRELIGILQNHPYQSWASDFKSLLQEMKKARDKAVAKGLEALSSYYHRKFSRRYDTIIAKGLEMNPLQVQQQTKKRGRPSKGKIRALIERLQKLKDAVCLFAYDFSVPYTNNQAEQDIRIMKVKNKVTGGFRTEQGVRDYLKIMSYAGTAKKNKINVHDAIRQAVCGNIQWTLECGI